MAQGDDSGNISARFQNVLIYPLDLRKVMFGKLDKRLDICVFMPSCKSRHPYSEMICFLTFLLLTNNICEEFNSH